MTSRQAHTGWPGNRDGMKLLLGGPGRGSRLARSLGGEVPGLLSDTAQLAHIQAPRVDNSGFQYHNSK